MGKTGAPSNLEVWSEFRSSRTWAPSLPTVKGLFQVMSFRGNLRGARNYCISLHCFSLHFPPSHPSRVISGTHQDNRRRKRWAPSENAAKWYDDVNKRRLFVPRIKLTRFHFAWLYIATSSVLATGGGRHVGRGERGPSGLPFSIVCSPLLRSFL